MAKYLKDEEVEEEIAELNKSPYVAMARRENRLKYKRRQYLYQLRNLEKRGRELEQAGVTMEMLYDEEDETPCINI